MSEILNSELNQYWSFLDKEERESVLSVIKSFLRLKGKEVQNSEDIYTVEFKDELRKRKADYEAGNAQLISAQDSKKRIEALRQKING